MALMDPVLVWALVACAALGGLYDLGRRVIASHRDEELNAKLKPLLAVAIEARDEGKQVLQKLEAQREAHERIRDTIEVQRQDHTKLRADLEAFIAEDKKTWDTVGVEWRKTVAELTAKVDGVTNAAESRINGALSGLDAMAAGRKDWR